MAVWYSILEAHRRWEVLAGTEALALMRSLEDAVCFANAMADLLAQRGVSAGVRVRMPSGMWLIQRPMSAAAHPAQPRKRRTRLRCRQG